MKRLRWTNPDREGCDDVEIDFYLHGDAKRDPLAEDVGSDESERLGGDLEFHFGGSPVDLARLSRAILYWVTHGQLTSGTAASIVDDCGTIEEVEDVWGMEDV